MASVGPEITHWSGPLTAAMESSAVSSSRAFSSATVTASMAPGAAVVGTAAATTTAASTGAAVVAAKWIAAISIVAAVGGGGVVAAKKMSAPAPAPAPVAVVTVAAAAETHVRPVDHVVPSERAIPPVEPVPSVAAADLPNVEPKRVHATSAKSERAEKTEKPAKERVEKAPAVAATEEPPPAPVPSTLGAEVSSLDAARTALRGGDPARALRELDAFDAKHPGSALAEDAAFLRFDAYVALGDRAGADRAARSFLARYASSPRAAKVKRWLDGAN